MYHTTSQHDYTVLPLSSSKWSLFFTSAPTSSHIAATTTKPFDLKKCGFYYSQPVYVITILTWQVGHLIVDVLEPLYNSVTSNGSRPLNPNIHIAIDCANAVEKEELHELILRDVYESDTPFSLLKLFTVNPIVTKHAMFSMPTNVCFEEVTLELDVKDTYYIKGYEGYPDVLKIGEEKGNEVDGLVKRYGNFKNFLVSSLTSSFPSPPSSSPFSTPTNLPMTTIIKRTGRRELLNFPSLLPHLSNPTIATLETTPLREQFEIFRTTDILISQYGSGGHNSVFLHRGSVMVLLLQPGWCDFNWAYANQALLSGVSVVSVCPQKPIGTEGMEYFRFAHKAWHQGPWATKDASYEVDIDAFKEAVQTAEKWVKEYKANPFAPKSTTIKAKPKRQPREEYKYGISLHVSDLHILPHTPGNARLMLVFEVLMPQITPRPPLFSHPFDNDDYALCVTDFNLNLHNPDGSDICQPTTNFNEFSTLDLHLPLGTELNLRAWLRKGGADVEGSETYFNFVVLEPNEGLKISTVTHVTGGMDPIYHNRPPLLHDYRIFNSQTGLFSLKSSGIGGEVTDWNFDGNFDGGPFVADLSLPYDLQLSVSYYCRENSIPPKQCSRVNKKITELAVLQNSLARRSLPPIQYHPTAQAPFVFLHHEKTAGSSLRNYIVQAARSVEAPFYVPCFTGDGAYHEDFSCYSFDLKNASEVNGGRREELAVMGGHFQWDAWDESAEPRCLVMVRHPVDRAISLYYERVFSRHDYLGGRFINELTVEEWRFVLEEFRGSAWSMWRDEGFQDTMCKMLLGESHFRGKREDEVDWERVHGMPTVLDAGEATARLKRCVVGIQNEWEASKRVIWRWFPWLKFKDDIMANTGMGSKAEKRGDLRKELLEEILKVNYCDMKVWEASLERFKEQVEWMEMEEKRNGHR